MAASAGQLYVTFIGRSGGCGVGWDLGDGDGINLCLGEAAEVLAKPQPKAPDDRDVYVAEDAARNYIAANPDCVNLLNGFSGPYEFVSQSHAKAVLRLAKAAVRASRSEKVPLEDWEQKALAAGWKPPKGRI